MKDFDVIVVGSGAGGGVAAWKFAQRGERVLVLERGRPLPDGPPVRDHLRNHRYSKYGHNTGPDSPGNPRVFADSDGNESTVEPIQWAYNNNAMGLGGGTAVYGAQAWRFHPLDFRMGSTYGTPPGSSLADWPIEYEELAPFYETLEWELGVSGSVPAANMPAMRELPMSPLRVTRRGKILIEAAEQLGWAHQRVRMMINSVPRNGRGACVECQHCVGYACPTQAKGGTQNTVLPQVAATAGCEIWTDARVIKILVSPGGKVTGVSANVSGKKLEVSAEVVVVACGAIETARLLLSSPSAFEPNGIGNNHDLVGRNLQGHYYPGARAEFDEPINDMIGPGPVVSVTHFNHGNEGIIGGGMLADDFISVPAHFVSGFSLPGLPRYGAAFKEAVRKAYLRSFHIFGPVQDIPNPRCRVTLDPKVVDDLGIPVARLSGTTHPETVKTAQFMAERAVEWVQAAGAPRIWKYPVGLGLSAGQHQAGTCRMSEAPGTGVVDSRGRVFGHENLLICDTSVHVTNGGFNPFLTAMATSLRTATLFD